MQALVSPPADGPRKAGPTPLPPTSGKTKYSQAMGGYAPGPTDPLDFDDAVTPPQSQAQSVRTSPLKPSPLALAAQGKTPLDSTPEAPQA